MIILKDSWIYSPFPCGCSCSSFLTSTQPTVLHQYRWGNCLTLVILTWFCEAAWPFCMNLPCKARAGGRVGDRWVVSLDYSGNVIPRTELSWFWLDWLGFIGVCRISVSNRFPLFSYFGVTGASGHVTLIHLHHVRGSCSSCGCVRSRCCFFFWFSPLVLVSCEHHKDWEDHFSGTSVNPSDHD